MRLQLCCVIFAATTKCSGRSSTRMTAPCRRPFLHTQPGHPSIAVYVHRLQPASSRLDRERPSHLLLWMRLTRPSPKQRWRRLFQNCPMAKLQATLAGQQSCCGMHRITSSWKMVAGSRSGCWRPSRLLSSTLASCKAGCPPVSAQLWSTRPQERGCG